MQQAELVTSRLGDWLPPVQPIHAGLSFVSGTGLWPHKRGHSNWLGFTQEQW